MTRDLAEILLVFAALFLPGYIAPAADPSGGGLLLPAVVASFQALLLLHIMGGRGPGALAACGVRRPTAADLGAAIAAAAALLAVSSAMGWTISRLPEPVQRVLEPRIAPTAASTPAGFALLSLVAGYREELFYRCYLVTRLAALGLPAAAAVALAALVFGFGHLYQGPAAVALAMLQAVAFGVLLLRGRSVHGLALAHALYNFAVLAWRQGG